MSGVFGTASARISPQHSSAVKNPGGNGPDEGSGAEEQGVDDHEGGGREATERGPAEQQVGRPHQNHGHQGEQEPGGHRSLRHLLKTMIGRTAEPRPTSFCPVMSLQYTVAASIA